MSGAVPALEDSAEGLPVLRMFMQDSVLKDRVLIGKFEEMARDEGWVGPWLFVGLKGKLSDSQRYRGDRLLSWSTKKAGVF